MTVVLKNQTSTSITGRDGNAILTQCEIRGPFRIHPFLNGRGEADWTRFTVSPINCDFAAGTFKNITTARKMADALAAIPALWESPSADEMFPDRDTFRAAFDAVREHRLPV